LLWAPLVLVHLSVAMRLWLGDALGLHLAWQLGGSLNEVALLLFAGLVVWSLAGTPRRVEVTTR